MTACKQEGKEGRKEGRKESIRIVANSTLVATVALLHNQAMTNCESTQRMHANHKFCLALVHEHCCKL